MIGIEWKVTDTMIAAAQYLREERDRVYGNIYEEADTDIRWVGDLGEICFDSWLTNIKCQHDWIKERPAGKPDFLIGDVKVDVKTVKRKVPYILPTFGAQITASHAQEDIDHFFFMCYQISRNPATMVLLGGLDKLSYLSKATFYKDGDSVHKDYGVRGHNIYNLEIKELISPYKWLREIGVPYHLSDNSCAGCGKEITSQKVIEYCQQHKSEFDGGLYCFTCQQNFPRLK